MISVGNTSVIFTFAPQTVNDAGKSTLKRIEFAP